MESLSNGWVDRYSVLRTDVQLAAWRLVYVHSPYSSMARVFIAHLELREIIN